jgi:hypothetical protein
MIFRLRFQQKGGHIHGRLFQATAPGHTWQKNGDLVFDEAGWGAFSALAALGPLHIELLPEGDTTLERERWIAQSIPDCECRNSRCGHKASVHVGPAGACIVDGCTCGPGGWT